MADKTNIEWTDATWSPVSGCTPVSEGCDHCYSVAITNRLEKMGLKKYAGLTVLNKIGDRHFNGVVKCHEDCLSIPLRWHKPKRIFVNSMSDTFHRDVPFDFIDRMFAVMALCPQHTFQVLTKRPSRMADYLNTIQRRDKIGAAKVAIKGILREIEYPLANVWLGASVENQEQADKRIPALLQCPAAVRFISIEPMLGPIDLMSFGGGLGAALQWVIVGAESGPGRRPMMKEWAESVREQCSAAGIAFFMKQMQVNGRISGEIDTFPADLRVREFPADCAKR